MLKFDKMLKMKLLFTAYKLSSKTPRPIALLEVVSLGITWLSGKLHFEMSNIFGGS